MIHPAHAGHRPLAHQGEIAGILELVGVALEDDDVLRPHTDTLEPLDTGDHDLAIGNAADSAGDAARLARFRRPPTG